MTCAVEVAVVAHLDFCVSSEQNCSCAVLDHFCECLVVEAEDLLWIRHWLLVGQEVVVGVLQLIYKNTSRDKLKPQKERGARQRKYRQLT